MNELSSKLVRLRDPHLAPHALSALPAWAWSTDASHILWANPNGAAIFGAPTPAALATRHFDAGQPAAAQVAQLAATLPAEGTPRLERLRGFGAGIGRALTCACSRVTLADGRPAVLVVSSERAGPNLSLEERVRRLLAGSDLAIAAFLPDGTLLHAEAQARASLARESLAHASLGGAASLAALGAGALAEQAIASGHAEGATPAGPIVLDRVGGDGDTVLIATFAAAAADQSAPFVGAPVASAATDAAVAESAAEPASAEPASAEPASAGPPSEHAADEPVAMADAPPAATSDAALPAEPDAPPAITEAPLAAAATLPPTSESPSAAPEAPAAIERRHPLRFVWQMDAEDRFTIGSNDFIELIGPRSATALGRPWGDIAAELGLDPDGQIARAIASRDTWSGLTLAWPVDGSTDRLSVELSGLPVFDRDRVFRGYRGFGVCRDLAQLAALAQARRTDATAGTAAAASEPVSFAENVVPFPAPTMETDAPSLSPVEHRAFRELSLRLTQRLGAAGAEKATDGTAEGEPRNATAAIAAVAGADAEGAPPDEKSILDRLPVGVLVYSLDHLLYANPAFLAWSRQDSLAALTEAGGLDSLLVEASDGAAEAGDGQPLTVASERGNAVPVPVPARLFNTVWAGERAHALVLTPPFGEEREQAAAAAADLVRAELGEVRSILDTATDGTVVLDRAGRILSCNRSAEALFGYEAHQLVGRAFVELFAPESERVASDYLDGLVSDGVASLLNDGREVIGRVRQGGLIPLFMTMGPLGSAEKFCAVFRDVTQWKKTEEELTEAKRQAERASSAKSDFLAKISHEIRTPLNAIIGFSEVMMAERFGPIGNERYRDYLKDIHSSGGHLLSLINDLLDLSKIEAGKMDLSFTGVTLNDVTHQCVAIMQAQANRERIIIRTSLSPKLPQIVADTRSVRQIVLNLLSNSIKFTQAGGQVIVSTALTDGGEVVLRVRDTGIGMNEQDIATALEPFRQLATSGRWGSGGTGLGLPLTKALAEANRATFRITSTPNAGTLVEIAFPATRVLAQ